jgi:transcriptional regulator with XRE-family HTH domain
MDTLQRLRRVINWLIFQEIADSDKDLADRLGYTKSSFSQILNGKVPLSEKFVKKLCSLDENINGVWILEGDGEMLLSGGGDSLNSQKSVTIPADVWNVIQAQAHSLSSRDKQIDELIDMLKSQLAEKEKTDVRRGDTVTSAVAG